MSVLVRAVKDAEPARARARACLCAVRAISVSLNRRLIFLAALITRATPAIPLFSLSIVELSIGSDDDSDKSIPEEARE